jgi:hypothetical protein
MSDIVHEAKQQVVLEIRVKDVFFAAKQLEEVGLEVKTVLHNVRCIFGDASSSIIDKLKLHPFVSSVEIEEQC